MEFEKLKHPFQITCADEGLNIWWKAYLYPAYLVKSHKLPDWLELVVTEHYDKSDGVVWQAHDKKTGWCYSGNAVDTDRGWLVENIIDHSTQFVTEADYNKKVAEHNTIIASFIEVTEDEAINMLGTEESDAKRT